MTFEEMLAHAREARSTGRAAEALEWFGKALVAGAPAEECQSQSAQLLFGMQRFEEAAVVYRAVLERRPDDIAARCGLARSLDKLQRWGEAAQEFRTALRFDPSRSDAKLALGICLLRLEQGQQALAIFEERLAADPEDQFSLFGKTVALHLTGCAADAAGLYRKLVAREPAMAQALASFGVSEPKAPTVRAAALLAGLISAAFAGDDYAAAEQCGVELTAAAPEQYEAWFNLGVARQRLSRLPEAAEAYQQAVRLRPDSAGTLLALAVVRHAAGDVPGATECYQKALALDDNLETALWNLGLLHEGQGDMRAAEELYGHLVEVTPASAEAWFRLAHARFDRGDFRASVAAYETCLRLRAGWAEARYNLGLAYWRLDRFDRAQASLEAALNAAEPPAPVWRALAGLALDRRDDAAALRRHLELIERGDSALDVLYNAALLQHQAGRLAEAIELYEQVLHKDPACADALLNLGLAQKASGDSLQAVISCQKAIGLQPELAEKYFDRIAWMKQQSGSGSPA